jgi:ribose 5-phosphate isomerase B
VLDGDGLSLRLKSSPELEEILDAWFAGSSSAEASDLANIARVAEIEQLD